MTEFNAATPPRMTAASVADRRTICRSTSAPMRSARRTVFHILLIVATLCSGVTAAVAQPNAKSAMSNFRTIDTDGDAKLDRRELAAAARRDFDRLDIDRDGYLTRGELAQTRGKTLLLPFPGRLSTQNAFMAADTDHDRKIDRHEYEIAVVRAYMRCDRNRDSTIEVSDLRHCAM
jgi:hypothetical protein